MDYEKSYKNGKHSSIHNNKGMQKPRAKKIQAQMKMKLIIFMNVDQMPLLMKGTQNGCSDGLPSSSHMGEYARRGE